MLSVQPGGGEVVRGGGGAAARGRRHRRRRLAELGVPLLERRRPLARCNGADFGISGWNFTVWLKSNWVVQCRAFAGISMMI